MMNHYLVITPSYEQSYGWDEPPEFGCDTCEVIAENEEDAKILALKLPDMKHWIRQCRFGEVNPLVGLKVENMRCKHGFCYCYECFKSTGQDICPECDREADEYERTTNEVSVDKR